MLLQGEAVVKLDIFPSDVVHNADLSSAIARDNIANFLRNQAQIMPWWTGQLDFTRGCKHACRHPAEASCP